MILFLKAEFNVGGGVGYSRHGLRIQKNYNKTFSPVSEDQNGGYFKVFVNYQRHMINNLDLKVEVFGGNIFKEMTQNQKSLLKPYFVGGVVAKGELDFEEERSLYLLAGLQISVLKLSNFTKQDSIEPNSFTYSSFFITPIVGIGGSIYVNKKISFFGEITHSGYFSDHSILMKNEEIKMRFLGLRIGLGINIKIDTE